MQKLKNLKYRFSIGYPFLKSRFLNRRIGFYHFPTEDSHLKECEGRSLMSRGGDEYRLGISLKVLLSSCENVYLGKTAYFNKLNLIILVALYYFYKFDLVK
jgi:hypothetical protein